MPSSRASIVAAAASSSRSSKASTETRSSSVETSGVGDGGAGEAHERVTIAVEILSGSKVSIAPPVARLHAGRLHDQLDPSGAGSGQLQFTVEAREAAVHGR